MTQPEGQEYLASLVRAYLERGEPFPYEKAAMRRIVRIADPMGDELSPRRINITADLLTNEVLSAGTRDSSRAISESDIVAALSSLGQSLVTALASTE